MDVSKAERRDKKRRAKDRRYKMAVVGKGYVQHTLRAIEKGAQQC